ncbi:hypothetical protein Nepgr_004146 [Nepenthes gracilis]|uniref:Ubiquitin-activating enzyme E1 FCCH domain-containing protein n=1 Tax=Nepenthes gracilis TaxID=150966 RepID=A0AAD3XES7_NEPGR|nr:hypothetical protein Nepgr_004146 [Nepenthes gracilis]
MILLLTSKLRNRTWASLHLLAMTILLVFQSWVMRGLRFKMVIWLSFEVIGMTILHGGNPRKLKNASPYSYTLNEDTLEYGTIERGGIVTSVQQPKVLAFNPFPKALKDPGDGRFGVISYNVLQHFTFGTGIVLNSMTAMVGDIVGQDVNACIGKFHPIFQLSYFHSAESLSSQRLDPNDLWPFNKHYDAPTSIFGSKLQKTIANARVFVVGFGARGCDFLKYLALMGGVLW